MSGKQSYGGTAPNQFLNGPNYQKIVGFLRQHYASKLGTQAIPERMDTRLQKTVQHYMTEVSRLQGSKPVNTLTQEVLRETTSSIDSWIKKQEPAPTAVATTIGAFSKPEDYTRMYEDTSTRYDSMMAERAPPAMPTQMVPDFRMAQDMMESEEDPVILMQRMQKQRDDQARALGLAPSQSVPSQAPRLDIREITPSASNPIPPQAEAPPPLLAPRPQEFIIPQEEIVKYRETEYNIFVTSSDRDWLRNTSENRYNFSVNFNTGTKKTGFAYNTAIQERFRNVQRIEFVKAIVPIEALNPLVRVTSNNPSIVYDTTRVVNVFSLPFASIRIAEVNGNGFSTNPEEDNTFAIVQYDTTWSSDLSAPANTGVNPAAVLTKSGYTGMIPKFLKAQKVYSPNPLATLQRLSFRMERHSGDLLSADSDVLSVKRIVMSGAFSSVGTNNTVYSVDNPQNAYVFLETSTYFPFSAVAEGDHIQLAGYVPNTASDASSDFTKFVNRVEGHYVIAVGYVNGSGAVVDGRNVAGYCNVIVLRNRFDDPTTGSTNRTSSYFGGSSGSENTFASQLNNTSDEPNLSGAALINLSRQTHFVLRIITRDMDASSNIRPDNV
jgi:hypothetical protein